MNRERDLFGNLIRSHAPRRSSGGVRKIGYAAALAFRPGRQRCGTCISAMPVTHKGRKSHKCELVSKIWTPGEETDINLRAPACRRWERKPFEKKGA